MDVSLEGNFWAGIALRRLRSHVSLEICIARVKSQLKVIQLSLRLIFILSQRAQCFLLNKLLELRGKCAGGKDGSSRNPVGFR